MSATPQTNVAADAGPRLYGVIDVLQLGRVAGWAIDRADADGALDIEIRREGRPVATVRADRLRKDLERGGLGTGRYGFSCNLEPPLEPGFEFTVNAIARSADGTEIELKRSGSGAGPDRDRRILERLFEEVALLRQAAAAPAALREPAAEAVLLEAIGRLEVAQARIEAVLSAVEPPAVPALAGLRALAAIALAIGLGSLGIGLWSLWG